MGAIFDAITQFASQALPGLLKSLIQSKQGDAGATIPAPVASSTPVTVSVAPSAPVSYPVGTIHMDVHRKWFDDNSTIGELYVNGVFLCNTLEDEVRADGVKVYGKTAIPAGTYSVELAPFRGDPTKMYPHLLNVPMFSGICMHGGNVPADTLGCILLGTYDPKISDEIENSGVSRDALLAKLKGATRIDITIMNDRPA